MPIFLTFGAVKILKIHNNHKVDMKKVILGVAIAGLAMSCQKVQAGGNKGALKREEGTERYTDDVMTDKPMKGNETIAKPTTEIVATDSTKVTAPAAASNVEIMPATLTSPMREKK